MRPYLYISRGGVHIFDLVKTREGLEEAVKYVENLGKTGGKILFLGTKRQAQEIIKQHALKAGVFYINQRWLGGLFTNWKQVGKSIKKLNDFKQKRAVGKFEKYTKKEQLLIDRKIGKLEKFLGGVANMDELPDAMFVVDIHREASAVSEARQIGVKVIGLVDSNSDPDLADIVIPGNDDAVNSIQLIVNLVTEAYLSGKAKFKIKKVN